MARKKTDIRKERTFLMYRSTLVIVLNVEFDSADQAEEIASLIEDRISYLPTVEIDSFEWDEHPLDLEEEDN